METLNPQNIQYPGRPDYSGPTAGEFGAVHHDLLCEHSHNIMERINYIRREKPEHECASRLHQLCYLPPERLSDEYARASAEYARARAEYIRTRAEDARACTEYDRTSTSTEYVHAYVEYIRTRAKYTRVRTNAEYATQIEALIRELVPDMTWNGTEYVYPS